MRRSFLSSSRTLSNYTALAVVLACLASACGGSDNGGGDTPPPGGGTPGQNPCVTASQEPGADDLSVAPTSADAIASKTNPLDPNPRGRLLDALWLHQSREGRIRRSEGLTAGRSSIDIGDIAVIPDEGDLFEAANTYDLRNLGLRFTRNGSGGYDVQRIDGTFRTALGTRLTLTDDDSRQVNVPFSFSFYGKGQTTAFVNSDGNVTFEDEDRASTDRNVGRMLTGPPRVSVFFADLDPSTGSGRVFANAAADQYTVTWCNVRGFDTTRLATTQLTLLPDGTVEMKFDEVGLAEAVVGLSPGRTGAFTIVNLSNSGPTAGGAGAVGERFADKAQLDTVEVARKFYRSHGDNFDQLVIWTDATVIDNAFAYEVTVGNQIRGIGLDIITTAAQDFGSAGRLSSFAMMDWVGKYPEDPLQRFLGENSTVSVLGQEVGHRWLAFLQFKTTFSSQPSEALLGRDQAHWSFFFDSDASVMEGNDIEDLGGGSFRTTAAVQRYSRLDQYAMGLVGDNQVPPFFYVDNPTNVAGNRTASSSPAVGVTFNGTRREVLIRDVIEAMGPRQPSVADSPKVHRQAFILVVGPGRQTDNAQVAKVDRIRRAWETFFFEATERRMQAVTTLQ
jgi:hypothetical protein